MANLIIQPARLKLTPGNPLPQSVSLTFRGLGLTPRSAYWISMAGESLWSVDTDEDGEFELTRSFGVHRSGSFHFEVSKIKNPRPGLDAETNRAFLIEYVEPKPSPLAWLKAQAAKQLAKLRARGDA